MSNTGSYKISEYQVTLPNGNNITRRKIIYLDNRGVEISREQYEEKPIPIDYVDVKNPAEIVNQITFTFDASEDWNGFEGVSDRFIKRAGGNYTNITPFIAWTDCVLIGISISSREEKEWESIIFVNGEEAANLNSDGKKIACGRYEFKILEGSEISIYVKGENIQNPGVQLVLTTILKPISENKK